MNIIIKTIAHRDQRYDTCGDYWIDPDGTYQVRISNMPDWRFGALVLIHELFEMFWCIVNKIPFKAIDDFDMAYELHRKKGDDSEPGDDSAAPYYTGHQLATGIERVAAAALGVRWEEYGDAIEALE